MNALLNGFNAIASNVAVILFPIVLDVFLWLGPRLKADALLSPIMDLLPEMQRQAPADQAKLFGQIMTDFYNGFNLFSVFRTYPLGVFSLLSVNISVKSPLGTRAALGVADAGVLFILLLVLTVIGWVAGSLYFGAVARVALKPKMGPGILRTLLQSVLLSGVWLLLFMLGNLPGLVFLWGVTLLNDLMRSILLMLLVVPASWVILSIFFSFHGIFANAENAFASTRNSLRLLRYGLPSLGWFAMLALVISQGMDMLWRAAPAESWMMGVGILGHAFISSGLLAASFIYYRDLNIWIEHARDLVKQIAQA
jgi:hypothetical protein